LAKAAVKLDVILKDAGLEIVGGTQTLSGVNAYTNVTQIDTEATLALKGNGSIANSLYVGFLGAGTLDISQMKAGTSVAGLFDPTGTAKVALGSQTLTITGSSGTFFGGVIQDGGPVGSPNQSATGGALFKDGTGTLTLAGANTYTGSTVVTGATLGGVSIPELIGNNIFIGNGQRLPGEGTGVVFEKSILLRGDGLSAGQGHGRASVVPMLEGFWDLRRLACHSIHARSDGATVAHGNNKR